MSNGRDHPANFMAAMRSRKKSDLGADVEVDHIAILQSTIHA